MAMTLAMDREPEVARFIDTYKFDQDMATKRDRYGGGTSLPLNSDGYEDKQKALRDERHKDWLVQQDKPKEPVYYRVGTPEQGFPGLGEYERQRQEKNIARQKEYNEMLRKQRQAEQQKLEARRYAPQPRPAQPLGPQMDYNAASEQAKAEERKAYQDYMGNWRNDHINFPHKPYMDYWENQRLLKEERRREYNELLEKKAKEERYWALRGRPVTPPGGLNIGQYDRQVKEQAPQKKQEYKRMLDEQKYIQLKLRAMDHAADLSSKYVGYREEERPLVGSPRDINPYMHEKENKDKFRRDLKSLPVQNPSQSSHNVVNVSSGEDPSYKAFMEVEQEKARDKRKYAEELLKQQKEHMFLRARQEPEMAVIDRNAQSSQFLANKPPPGPSYGRGRDESSRQTPAFWNEGKQAQGPTSLSSVASRSNQSSAYAPMDEKRKHDSEVFQQQHSGKPAEIVKNPFYSSDDYEKFQKELKKKQEKEYSEFLSKQFLPNKNAQGLPLGQYKYEPMRLHLEAERNKEYNELLEKQNSPRRPKQVDGPQGLNIDVNYHREKQEWLEKQRNKDYNEYLKKKYGGNKTFRSSRSLPEKPSQPRSSFYYGNELEHEEKRKMLDDERRNDYNQFMKEQEPPRSKSIEIPSDADSGLPIGQHHHEAWRKFLREQRNTEYNQLKETKKAEVRNRNWNFDETGVLELKGDDAVQLKKRELRAERREDYNQYISQMKAPTRRNWPEPEGQDGLLVKSGEYDNVRQMYDDERKRDYNDTMRRRREQKVAHPGRRHEFVDSASGPYGGLFHGLGEHGNRSEDLNRERHREYNERLEQQYAGRDRPGGRPKWVQETLPNNTDRGRSPMKTQPPADQYQQMLNEKRREEANMRRYEDPEYQDRLAQGRDRGEAGQRYGY